MSNVSQLPSWVEYPLDHCFEGTTKKELESAIDCIGSKIPTKECYLQTVVDFVFPLWVEEFNDFKFQMKYVPQLKYRDIKEDRNFLPTNFNNNSRDGKGDAAILIVLPNGKKFPILIGELKAKVCFQELSRGQKSSDYLQITTVQLHAHRPASIQYKRQWISPHWVSHGLSGSVHLSN